MTIKFRKGNINPTTRTFPRTLAEAFPETPEPNFEKPMDKEDKIGIGGCALVALFLVVMVIGGWL